MTENRVTKLLQPGEFSDSLTDILREGARKLLAQAIEVEVASFLSADQGERLEDGRACVVRKNRSKIGPQERLDDLTVAE